jgi:CO/xanthine dehydrogenase Mo-binding subunit
VANPGFLDYKIPTSCDTPRIEVVLIQSPSEEGPFGAKGVGEPCIIPTAPAIANAIQDAVQARVFDLPITPEKVLRVLKEP